MNLLRFYAISLVVLALMCALISTTEASAKKDSKIHRIKPIHVQHHQREQNQNLLRGHDFHEPPGTDGAKSRHLTAKAHISNKQLMSKLGLTKLRIPLSHNRKRLAVESRHHARPDDSHMFVIKLPPNGIYYSKTKTTKDQSSASDNGKKVSFNFRSNGKLGRIYHWNIPVLKKILIDNGRTSPMFRTNKDTAELLDIKRIPTWSKPWENDTVDKPYGKITAAQNKSLKKKKSPTYYAPANYKKSNFSKYFPGNGKPKGFYVMKKNQKQSYYKELIP